MNQNNQTSKEKQTHSKEKKKEKKLHYQVYLQEDRPIQPKQEDEIEY
ncbi:hypothetical protein ACERII_02795 [Evansella sp. AB-rgal1]